MGHEFMPNHAQKEVIELDTCGISESLRSAFHACCEMCTCPYTFLRALCDFFRVQYEQDPSLSNVLPRLGSAHSLALYGTRWMDLPPNAQIDANQSCNDGISDDELHPDERLVQ